MGTMDVRVDQYGLGGKPHKKDDRDWTFRSIAHNILGTAQADVAMEAGERWWGMHGSEFRINQGAEGTCVGHAFTNDMLAEPRQHAKFPSFSSVNNAHQFAREFYLKVTGDTTYQQGAYMRDALDTALDMGYIVSYYRCLDIEDVTTALLSAGPVLWASPWYGSMYYQDNQLMRDTGQWFIRVDPWTELMGFHAYLLTGVDLGGGLPFVRMQNSWGPSWGRNGTARITLDDLGILYDGDAYCVMERAF